MSNENNVVILEKVVHKKIKAAILVSLEGRGGNPVSEPFLVDRALSISSDVSLALTLITEMVVDGTLERLYAPAADNMHRGYRLPMYRLNPTNFL